MSPVIWQLVRDLPDLDWKKRVGLDPSTAEHPCLLIRKTEIKPRITLYAGKMKERYKPNKAGKPQPDSVHLSSAIRRNLMLSRKPSGDRLWGGHRVPRSHPESK